MVLPATVSSHGLMEATVLARARPDTDIIEIAATALGLTRQDLVESAQPLSFATKHTTS